VLPRTQSETSVQLLAVNATELPMDGAVEASIVSRGGRTSGGGELCALRVNRWANETRIGAKRDPLVGDASNGRSRRIADEGDLGLERLNWAETGPTGVARERPLSGALPPLQATVRRLTHP